MNEPDRSRLSNAQEAELAYRLALADYDRAEGDSAAADRVAAEATRRAGDARAQVIASFNELQAASKAVQLQRLPERTTP